MGEIWIEFFQVDFNIPPLRDVQLPRSEVAMRFEEAYESILTAYILWEDLGIVG